MNWTIYKSTQFNTALGHVVLGGGLSLSRVIIVMIHKGIININAKNSMSPALNIITMPGMSSKQNGAEEQSFVL